MTLKGEALGITYAYLDGLGFAYAWAQPSVSSAIRATRLKRSPLSLHKITQTIKIKWHIKHSMKRSQTFNNEHCFYTFVWREQKLFAIFDKFMTSHDLLLFEFKKNTLTPSQKIFPGAKIKDFLSRPSFFYRPEVQDLNIGVAKGGRL